MTPIDPLVEVLRHQERAAGAPRLAKLVGATHICVFIRDPELKRFLPGPGFPQSLPEGLVWRRFLDDVSRQGNSKARLTSPYTHRPSVVVADCIDDGAIVAYFGEQVGEDAHNLLLPSLKILAALLVQETQTSLAEIRASMAEASAAEARQFSESLSEAHDKIASILHAREVLTERLRREEEKLLLAHQVAGIGVWELDPVYRTINCSEQAARILEVPDQDDHRPLADLIARIHADDRQRIEWAFGDLAGRSEYNLQFRVVSEDGSVRWIENRGSLLESSRLDKPVVLWLSLDVTQRVLTEQSLVRSERLAVAGRLSASIAHEINNPLEALMNLLYLAEGTDDLSQVKQLLSVAGNQLKRVSMIARQSLRFYRDLSAPVRFCVRKLLGDALDFMAAEVANRKIQLVREFEDGNTDVNGWPAEIMQAVTNLVLNATQASPEGASVRVRLHRRKREVRLLIADRGSGIPHGIGRKVFEPFFSTKTEGGTGLGLWITQQIVDKHRGSIRMRSRTIPGNSGTVFRITLPDADSEWPPTITDGYRWLNFHLPAPIDS